MRITYAALPLRPTGRLWNCSTDRIRPGGHRARRHWCSIRRPKTTNEQVTPDTWVNFDLVRIRVPFSLLSGHVRVVPLDEAGRVQGHEKLPQLREPGGSELAFPLALDLAHRSADVLRGRVAALGELDSL